MKFRVGLITTLSTNIGDDFIREGIKNILRAALRGRELEFVEVNKHEPMTVYPEWHPVRLAESLPRGRGVAQRTARRTLHRFGFSRFDGCDLIVQCGAPVLWPGCHQAEWAVPIWDEVVSRLAASGVPVLNLAAGSSFAWESRETATLEGADAAYTRRIYDYCRKTTVRDPLAKRLYEAVGGEVPLIRCSALLAAQHEAPARVHEDLVLVNYMHGGGHYDWGQGSDPAAWEATARTVIGRLARRHQVAFLCHNQAEYDLAGTLAPGLPRYLPRTPQEYWQVARRAAGALHNRLHASVGMAGLGIPSVAVGTDTRMYMVEQVGLPVVYVKDAAADALEAQVEGQLADRAAESERLLQAQRETAEAYQAVLASVL